MRQLAYTTYNFLNMGLLLLQEFGLGKPGWYKMCPRDETNLEHDDAIERRHGQAAIKNSPQHNTVDEACPGELPEHNIVVGVSERRTHVSAHH